MSLRAYRGRLTEGNASGDTRELGTAERQEFHADTHTAALIPTAASNVWTVDIVPGELAYGLRREGLHLRRGGASLTSINRLRRQPLPTFAFEPLG